MEPFKQFPWNDKIVASDTGDTIQFDAEFDAGGGEEGIPNWEAKELEQVRAWMAFRPHLVKSLTFADPWMLIRHLPIVTKFIQVCEHLQKLEIRTEGIVKNDHEEQIQAFFQAISKHPRLEEVNVVQRDNIQQKRELDKLFYSLFFNVKKLGIDFDHYQFRDALLTAISRSNKLQRLHVDIPDLPLADFEQLFKFFEANPYRKLNSLGFTIGHRRQHGHVQIVAAIGDLLQRCNYIRELQVGSFRMSSADLELLCFGSPQNRSKDGNASFASGLRTLVLHHTDVTDETATALAKIIAKGGCALDTLNLPGHRMGAAGVCALLDALSDDTHLRQVSMFELYGSPLPGDYRQSPQNVGSVMQSASGLLNTRKQHPLTVDVLLPFQYLEEKYLADFLRTLARHPCITISSLISRDPREYQLAIQIFEAEQKKLRDEKENEKNQNILSRTASRQIGIPSAATYSSTQPSAATDPSTQPSAATYPPTHWQPSAATYPPTQHSAATDPSANLYADFEAMTIYDDPQTAATTSACVDLKAFQRTIDEVKDDNDQDMTAPEEPPPAPAAAAAMSSQAFH